MNLSQSKKTTTTNKQTNKKQKQQQQQTNKKQKQQQQQTNKQTNKQKTETGIYGEFSYLLPCSLMLKCLVISQSPVNYISTELFTRWHTKSVPVIGNFRDRKMHFFPPSLWSRDCKYITFPVIQQCAILMYWSSLLDRHMKGRVILASSYLSPNSRVIHLLDEVIIHIY